MKIVIQIMLLILGHLFVPCCSQPRNVTFMQNKFQGILWGKLQPVPILMTRTSVCAGITSHKNPNKNCFRYTIIETNLQYASNVLVPLLAMGFTSFISHGFLPETMLSVMLVPVIKDKAGKISSKDNYRPIALASVISKLVEVIMLDRIEMYMITNPNQFGFKRKHGTDQCICVLKEIIDL